MFTTQHQSSTKAVLFVAAIFVGFVSVIGVSVYDCEQAIAIQSTSIYIPQAGRGSLSQKCMVQRFVDLRACEACIQRGVFGLDAVERVGERLVASHSHLDERRAGWFLSSDLIIARSVPRIFFF